MKQISAKILASIMFGVTLLTPALSMAQSGGTNSSSITISKGELDVLAGELLSWKNNPDASSSDLIEQLCYSLGEKLYIMTGHTSTMITGQWNTLECAVAAVIPNAQPSDLLGQKYNRTYAVGVAQMPLADFMIGLRNGSGVEAINSANYNEIQKQAAEYSSVDEIADYFDNFIGWLVKATTSLLSSILSFLASSALYLMYKVVEFSVDTQNNLPDMVLQGWVMIRDFMNIFFILALIVIALATILRYESYNYRSLLVRLVFMALLINFSQIIAVTLISFSDTLMMMFNVEEGFWRTQEVVFNSFVTEGQALSTYLTSGQGAVDAVGNAIAKVIGLGMLTISFSAVALLLFVRLIGLWFLVMISPAAYALYVLPSTQEYARRWWDAFIKYLIWGPVALFFFQMGWIMMVNNGRGWIDNAMLNHLFISAFFWAGFLVAKKFGGWGAATITSTVQKYGQAMTTRGSRAYGNLWWRGSLPGWVASGVGRIGPGGKERGERWGKAVKEAIGTRTARIQNYPGNLSQKYIKNPQADRDKLVNRERRRTQIRKGYFRLDEEAAKKLPAADAAYAIQNNKYDYDFLNGAIENGSPETRLVVARAFAEGHLDRTKFKGQDYDNLWDKTREYIWRKSGRKIDDPDFTNFHNTPTLAVLNELEINEKADYNKNAAFADRVANSRASVKPKPRVRKQPPNNPPPNNPPPNNPPPNNPPPNNPPPNPGGGRVLQFPNRQAGQQNNP